MYKIGYWLLCEANYIFQITLQTTDYIYKYIYVKFLHILLYRNCLSLSIIYKFEIYKIQ